MKQKLLLPLLLVLLTCLGVTTAKAQTASVTFGDLTTDLPTGFPQYTSTAGTDPFNITRDGYTMTVTGAFFNPGNAAQGFTVNGYTTLANGTKTTGGTITFPVFTGKQVYSIAVTMMDNTYENGQWGLYNLKSPNHETAIGGLKKMTKGGTQTFVIPEDELSSTAQYQFRNMGTGQTSIQNITVYFVDNGTKKSTELSFSANEVTAIIGKPFTTPKLTSAVTPTWTSSNPAVATVNGNGEVTLLKAGYTIIKASFAGNGTYMKESASYRLNVIDPLSANGVVWTFGDMGWDDGYAVGTATPISYTDDGKLTTLTFAKASASNQPNYSADGAYVRLYSGNTLKVKVADGYVIDRVEFVGATGRNDNILNAATVSVGSFTGATSAATNAVWNFGTAEVSEGTLTSAANPSPGLVTQVIIYLRLPKLVMTATKNPLQYQAGNTGNARDNIKFGNISDASGIKLTYTSSDTSVVRVAADGTMTFVKKGQATIKASFAGNDYYAASDVEFTVNVISKPAPTIGFTGDVTSKTIGLTGSFDLKALITGLDADQLGAVKFSADPEGIVNVTEAGMVSALKVGTTKITVTLPETTSTDEAHAYFNVTVIDDRTAPAISFATPIVNYYKGLAPEIPAYVKLQGLTGATGLEGITYTLSGDIFTNTGTLEGTEIALKANTYGTGTVTANYPGNDTQYLAASATYKIVLTDPALPITLAPAQLGIQNGFAVPATVVSDTKLVTYNFGGTSYFMDNGGQFRLAPNTGKITVTADKGFVIDKIQVNYVSGSSFAVNGYTATPGTFDRATGAWTFTGLNETTATLTNTGSAQVNIASIVVTLRKEVVVISAKLASASVIYTKTYAAADNFKVTLNGEEMENAPALTYSIWANEACTEATDVATIDATTGVVSPEKSGNVYVQATLASTDNYVADAPAEFVLHVTDKTPVIITFNDNTRQLNMYGDETINIVDQIKSITYGEGVTPAEGTYELSYTVGEGLSETGDEVSAVMPTKDGKPDYALQQTKTAKVTVTFTPTGDLAETLAVSTASFNVTLVDNRSVPTFDYAKTAYEYTAGENEPAFEAPAPFAATLDPQPTVANIDFTCTNESLIEDNAVVIPSTFLGIQTVTVTADFNGDKNYKPATGTYTLTITGARMTVDQFLNVANTPKVGDKVIIEGYIVGVLPATGTTPVTTAPFPSDGNLVIATSAGNTTNVVFVQLTGDNAKNYGLASHPEYLGLEVDIDGSAATLRNTTGVNNVTMINLLKQFTIGAESTSISLNEELVLTGIPADYDMSNLTISATQNGAAADITITGNKIKFDATGTFTLTFTAPELPGYAAVNQSFDVNVIGNVVILPVGKTYIDAELMSDNFKVADASGADSITYSIVNGESGDYDAAGIALSGSGVIEFTIMTTEGATKTEKYIFDDKEAMMNVQFALGTGSEWYGNDVVYRVTFDQPNVISVDFTDEAWLDMTYYTAINFDKQLWAASIKVPQYAVDAYEAKSGVRAKAPIYEGPDPKNIVQYGAFAPASYFNIEFSSKTDAGNLTNAISFNQAPIATGDNPMSDGNQIKIYTQDDLDSPIYIIDYADGKVYAELPKAVGQSWAVNLWEGEVDLPAGKYYLATGESSSGSAAGTIFGATAAGITFAGTGWVDPEGETSNLAKANATGVIPFEADGTKTLYMKVELREAGQPVYGESTQTARAAGDKTTALYQLGVSTTSLKDIETGINGINADADVMWFNLQGERIAEPSEGIVIRVQGNKSEKVLIRK